MKKESQETITRSEIFFANKRLNIAVFLISFLTSSIPLLLNDEMILNNKYIQKYTNYICSIFTAFEETALSGLNYGLYDYIKFQLSWSWVPFILTFILSLYIISKIYMCSLGYKDYNRTRYFNVRININKSHANIFAFLLSIILLVFIHSSFLFETFSFEVSDNPIGFQRLIATSKLGSVIESGVMSLFAMFYAYFLIEFIALINKLRNSENS